MHGHKFPMQVQSTTSLCKYHAICIHCPNLHKISVWLSMQPCKKNEDLRAFCKFSYLAGHCHWASTFKITVPWCSLQQSAVSIYSQLLWCTIHPLWLQRTSNVYTLIRCASSADSVHPLWVCLHVYPRWRSQNYCTFIHGHCYNDCPLCTVSSLDLKENFQEKYSDACVLCHFQNDCTQLIYCSCDSIAEGYFIF